MTKKPTVKKKVAPKSVEHSPELCKHHDHTTVRASLGSSGARARMEMDEAEFKAERSE